MPVTITQSSNIADLQPLVDNTSIGSGDTIYLNSMSIDCASQSQNIYDLQQAGATVWENCPSVCLGTAKVCGNYNTSPTTCSDAGCTPSTGCIGGIQCPGQPNALECIQNGCSWTDRCLGTPTISDCSTLSTEAECSSATDAGCYWML